MTPFKRGQLVASDDCTEFGLLDDEKVLERAKLLGEAPLRLNRLEELIDGVWPGVCQSMLRIEIGRRFDCLLVKASPHPTRIDCRCAQRVPSRR